MAKRRKRAPVCEALEPRILYSADVLPLPVDSLVAGQVDSPIAVAQSGAAVSAEPLPVFSPDAAQPATAIATSIELVVIDRSVEGTGELVEDLLRQQSAGRALVLVVVDAGEDAIAALSQTLSDSVGQVSTIHFIGHGDETGMQLGDSRIDLPTLRARAAEFSAWGERLIEDADLLLYGCDLASTPQGMSVVNALATLTGADVAASSDLTGAAERGGDWELEYTAGLIESQSAFTIETQRSWRGVLANFVVTNTNDSGGGSLREAITNANSNAGADTIQFAIAGGGVQTINLLSALPAINDQVTLDGYTQAGSQANNSYNSDNAVVLIEINGASAGAGTDGLLLTEDADGTVVRGLVINRFDGFGILVSGLPGNQVNNITIAGNFIGTDSSGSKVAGLGNNADGIGLYDTSNVTIGGTTYADRNVIAGNGTLGGYQGGINLGMGSKSATILNNYIGVAADGSTVLGNAQYGVLADQGANASTIGSIDWPQRNLIAGAVTGIEVANNGPFNTEGIRIFGNSIWANSGLAIDLGANGYNGVTANDGGDGDTGPNALQNFPVITAAYTNNIAGYSGAVYITGTYAGIANEWYIFDFYADNVADPSGHGDARIPLGRVWQQADGFGNISFAVTGGMQGELPALPAGTLISATATHDATGNTSELSQNRVSLLGNLTVTTTNDTVNGDTSSIAALITSPGVDGISLREAILAANNTPSGGNSPHITFNIAGGGPHTISPLSALPFITGGVTIDGTSQPGYAGTPLIQIDGSFAGGGGVDGLRATSWSYAYALSITNFSGDGIQFDGAGSLVTASYLGVAPDGSAAGNAGYGVVMLGDNSFVGAYWGGIGNLISDNDQGGVLISGPSVLGGAVIRNRIGTDAAGTAALGTQNYGVRIENGADNVQIGRSNAGDGNLISGNSVAGIWVSGETTDGISIRNNIIGLNASGNAVIGTGNMGVWITGGADDLQIGGTAADEGNQIGGAARRGIELFGGSSGVVIEGNAIGTNFAGVLDLGNAWEGIYIGSGANANRVGGTSLAASNRIAFSGLDGIRVESSAGNGNTFYGNRIYGNDGLGIDLQVGGLSSVVTANDPDDTDTGVNNLQNFPVITRFATNPAANTIWIDGYLQSTPNSTFRLEYFFSDTPDPSGHGEGENYWAYLNVTTDVTGLATFNIASAATVAGGTWLTATATHLATGDTSEFSGQIAAVMSAPSVSTTGSALSYVENDPATAIDPGLVITDPDSTNLTGATVRISGNYVIGQDGLAFTDQLGITGTWNAALGVMTLSGTSSVANYQNALRSITYVNTSDNPSTALRTVEFSVSDGTSNSNTATRNVNVTAVADHLVTVNTTSDVADGDMSSIDALLADPGGDGLISLREAITATNNTANGAGADRIHFDIAAPLVGGAHRIELLSSLPALTQAVVIDATTEPDFVAAPVVELDGNLAGPAGIGLTLNAGSSNSTIRGLVINRFQTGITLQTGSTNNLIAGNRIGTSVDGLIDRGNSNTGIYVLSSGNVIGGSNPADRNLISGNDGYGIFVGFGGDNNYITGNWIGVDATGNAALGNTFNGIYLGSNSGNRIGGSAPGEGNVISAHGDIAVRMESGSGHVIQGNWIGTGADGTTALGNLVGVSARFGTTDVLIGGATAGEGNIIRNNGYGVSIQDLASADVAILGNSIAASGTLGIDLGGDGVTFNDALDADTGPNALQNFPVLLAASSAAGNTTIIGSLNGSALTSYRIEFFSSVTGDASGYGEGMTYLGFDDVVTDGSGNTAINATLIGVSVPLGHLISATATVDLGGGQYGATSEFAQNVVSGSMLAPAIANLGGDSLSYAEGDGAVVIDQGGDALVSDADSTNFDTATLTVGFIAGSNNAQDVLGIRQQGSGPGQMGVSGATISYGGIPIGTFVGGSGGANLVVTLNASASHAAVSALVQNITYENLNTDAPTTGARTVRFVLTDGDGGSSADYDTTVIVSGVNDAPLALAENYTLAEDATLTVLAPGVLGNDSDPDGDTLLSAASSLPLHDQIFSFTTAGNIVYQAGADFHGTDSFTYYATDGLLASNLVTVTITVTPVADTPTVSGAVTNEDTQTSAGLVIVRNAADGAEVTHFKITGITAGTLFQSDGVTVIADGDFISFAQGNAGLRFTPAPNSTASGSFTVQASTTANDSGLGGGIVTATILVNPVNDNPLLFGLDGTPTFVEAGAAVVLDANVNVADVELSAANNFSGATLTLLRDGGANTDDLFSATGTLAALAEGGAVIVAGTNIGSVITNSGGTLLLTFNASATNSLVNAAVQQIAYANSSSAPPAGVQINWTFNDGNVGGQGSGGALVENGLVSVTISPANNSPVLGAVTLAVGEGQTVSLVPADIGITDPDSVNFVFTVSALSGGFFQLGSADGVPITSFTSAQLASGLVQFVDDGDESAPAFALTASDGVTGSNTQAAAITFTAINDAPMISVPAVQPGTEDTPLVFSVAAGNAIVLADSDAGALPLRLALSVSQGSLTLAQTSGLVFETGSGFNEAAFVVLGSASDLNAALDGLIFMPGAQFSGNVRLDVSLVDQGHSGAGASLSVSASTIILIAAVNDPPSDLVRTPAVVLSELSPPGTSAGVVLAFDPDDASGFMFSLTGETGPFRIDPLSGEISVATDRLPAFDVQSSYQIFVTATDPGGAAATRVFTIQVAPQAVTVTPPTSSETGRNAAPTDFATGTSAAAATGNGSGAGSVSDASASSRERMVAALDSDDPSQRRRAPAQLDGIRTAKRAELAAARPNAGADAAALADEQISVQIIDARGETLFKRGFSGARLFELLRLEHQRHQADESSDWSAQAPIVRLPAQFVDWSPQNESDKGFHVQLETVQLGGAALSIGLMFYALRAGGLMAAMLTALPAWSSMDPLVVLAKNREGEHGDWGDVDDIELDRDEAGVRRIISGGSTQMASTRVTE